MELPRNQDVVVDMLGWTAGPLPSAELEHIAFLLFGYRFPTRYFADPLFDIERHDCRRLALTLRVKFLKLDRWTVSKATERLTDESCQLLYGDKAVSTRTRGEVMDYAESYLEDLYKLFGGDRLISGSESWRNVPEEDPDDSELEVVRGADVDPRD